MLNKVRDKLSLHIMRKLYGSRFDFACSFYGRDTSCNSEVLDSAAIGVVFQGPIVDEAKLREGLTHYRRLLPASSIAISTWDGSLGTDFRESIKDLRIICVETKPPVVGGIMNVNRQIISTENGIFGLLQESEPAYIVKARTDYFPWRPDKAIRQMLTLAQLLGGADRIWGIDFNTRMDLPFSFSDIFQIGSVDNMKNYWRGDDLYKEDVSVQRFFELTDYQRNVVEVLRLQPAEMFLARRYLVSQGCAYDFTSLRDYQSALVEWFGILDSQHIELAFGKYSLAVPGYEPLPPDANRKYYVKSQDWLSMIAKTL